MGGCMSSPEGAADKSPSTKAGGGRGASASHGASAGAGSKNKVPDFGLAEFWEVIKLLGTGGEGETWLCREKATDREVAIKLVRRPIPKSITQIIQREIRILADLGDGHLNIVHAEEVVLSRTHVGLVMEYVKGGNMVGYVTKMRETREARGGLCLNEDEANYLFRQLVWAVQFCHENHVAHRDLKLDNTLLDDHQPPRLKLCDFGFAKGWATNSNMDTMRIGTPEYMGPELISGRSGYDGKKVDVWASGVLLFVLLLGMFPFEMEDENYVNTAGLYSIWIQQVRTSWQENPHNSSGVSRLSPECRDLLDRMFDVNQDSRISIEQIVKHPWFSHPLPQRYEDALAALQKEQATITSRFSVSNFRSKERDAALQSLLDRATQPPAAGEGITRVPLARSRDALATLPPIDTAINPISEGGGGGEGVTSGGPSRAVSQ
ncbi:MAG: kinase-like domain-containing protein [Monoraphidium minutum]|nr:MAG: kinase-like domain-containing protein [Monoraphidium minutum]